MGTGQTHRCSLASVLMGRHMVNMILARLMERCHLVNLSLVPLEPSHLTEAAQRAGTSPSQVSEALAPCYFICGPSRPVSNRSHTHTATCVYSSLFRQPLQHCTPGNSACLEQNAWRHQRTHTAGTYPGDWKYKVCGCRIHGSPDEPGVDTRHERAEAITEMVSAASPRPGVRHCMPVCSPNKDHYIPHMVQHNIKTVMEAEQTWFRAKDDPSIDKTVSGGGMGIAVEGTPETHGFRERAWSRSVCNRASLPIAGHLEDAMPHMAKHGVGASALHGGALGKVAEVFSSVSSSHRGCPIRIDLEHVEVAVPASGVVILPIHYEMHNGYAGKQQSAPPMSEEGHPAKAPKRARTGTLNSCAKNGLARPLLDRMRRASDEVKDASNKYGRGKNNVVRPLEGQFVFLKEELGPAVRNQFGRFMDAKRLLANTHRISPKLDFVNSTGQATGVGNVV